MAARLELHTTWLKALSLSEESQTLIVQYTSRELTAECTVCWQEAKMGQLTVESTLCHCREIKEVKLHQGSSIASGLLWLGWDLKELGLFAYFEMGSHPLLASQVLEV